MRHFRIRVVDLAEN